MPADTTCATCGFEGPHGFTGCVGSMMHYYHTTDEKGPTGTPLHCGFWTVDGKEFKTKADAWRYLRRQYPAGPWRSAWDARILEHDERKAARLFKQWAREAMRDPV